MTERDRKLARWLDLTRRILPGMAKGHGWPISLDHCFMRVCLDAATGRPWHEAIRRPAIRHMTDAQLDLVVAVAEQVAESPSMLPGLNRQSLHLRGRLLHRRS